jgi:nicotinate dehydrogenase subunit A
MANVAQLQVNGRALDINAEPSRTLLSVLRDDLGLTGTRYGCGEGECGACTVLLNGVPARACITTVAKAAGKSITTIEGIEQNGHLHPLQEAFLVAGAMQCGYCTSGMIVTGVALLRTNPNPSDADITSAMDGNICRCGTYQRIVAAIKSGAKALAAK